jgi:enterobacteria phage integrase
MGGRLMPVADMAVVRIPYVKVYTDRAGKVRRYFRKPRRKAVPLPGVPGSTDFMAAYQAALGEVAPMPAYRQGPGTVGALICDYLKSPAFTDLAPSSKKLYRTVLDRFGTLHGHRMVQDMPRAKVATYVYNIGAEHPAMANVTKSVLRKLLSHTVRTGYRNDNPVAEIDRYKAGTRHTWTDDELAAFERRWPPGTRERLAYALLLHTGQRGGDVVKMRRADVSGGAITVVQQKTGVELSIPIDPELLAAMKARPSNGLTLIGDNHGRPMSRHTLTLLVRRAAAAAGLPRECLPHGLRKAQMRRLAERGASAKQIASISGHKTLREIERYTLAADQKRLSRGAMAKLKREPPVSNAPGKVSNRKPTP